MHVRQNECMYFWSVSNRGPSANNHQHDFSLCHFLVLCLSLGMDNSQGTGSHMAWWSASNRGLSANIHQT